MADLPISPKRIRAANLKHKQRFRRYYLGPFFVVREMLLGVLVIFAHTRCSTENEHRENNQETEAKGSKPKSTRHTYLGKKR